MPAGAWWQGKWKAAPTSGLGQRHWGMATRSEARGSRSCGGESARAKVLRA